MPLMFEKQTSEKYITTINKVSKKLSKITASLKQQRYTNDPRPVIYVITIILIIKQL